VSVISLRWHFPTFERTMAALAQASCVVASSATRIQRGPHSDHARRPRPAFGAATRSCLRGDSSLANGTRAIYNNERSRVATTVTAASAPTKAYGYGYGYGYGWSYGHGYGDADWGGVGGKTRDGGPMSSSSPNTASSSQKSGLARWWAKAGKIDKTAIAALGGAALLSYGLISNLFYVSSLLGAMYTACKVHAVSPLGTYWAFPKSRRLFANTRLTLFCYHLKSRNQPCKPSSRRTSGCG
jgi:hypothetical protein